MKKTKNWMRFAWRMTGKFSELWELVPGFFHPFQLPLWKVASLRTPHVKKSNMIYEDEIWKMACLDEPSFPSKTAYKMKLIPHSPLRYFGPSMTCKATQIIRINYKLRRSQSLCTSFPFSHGEFSSKCTSNSKWQEGSMNIYREKF